MHYFQQKEKIFKSNRANVIFSYNITNVKNYTIFVHVQIDPLSAAWLLLKKKSNFLNWNLNRSEAYYLAVISK